MDYSQYANAGLENKTSDDVNIPVLIICQKGSAQFDTTHRNHPQKAIDGIKPGDIFNSATNEVIARPIQIIPCNYIVNYVEWKPGGQDSAPAAVHTDPAILSQCTKNDKKKDELPNGNIVEQTYNFLVKFSTDGESWSPALLRMKSTQVKNAKSWITIMDSIKFETPDGTKFTPPTFSHIYELSTQPESNQAGSWFGYSIKMKGVQEDDALALECAEMYESAAKQLSGSTAKAIES